jgi:sulfhydrogenase subunit delta
MTKPTIGIFSLTCCEGCQIEILDLEDVILDVIEKVDIVSFRLAKEKNLNESFDIAFVEGSISTQEDVERAKAIREKAKVLVALGSCACTGGVQSVKNFQNKKEVEHTVYEGTKMEVVPVDPRPLSAVMTVDYQVRGCPIDKREFVEILKAFLMGNKPLQREFAVCVECRVRENPCLLEQGLICLGPVTYAGCGAVCTSNGLFCIGCRGMMDDANTKAFVDNLKFRKHTGTAIKDAFTTILNKEPK